MKIIHRRKDRKAEIQEQHAEAVERADQEVKLSEERLEEGQKVQRQLGAVTHNHYAELIRRAITGEG